VVLEAPVLDEARGYKRFSFVDCLVPTEAPRRHDRLKLAEVEFTDRTQGFCGRGILKVVRQALQPGVIFRLKVC